MGVQMSEDVLDGEINQAGATVATEMAENAAAAAEFLKALSHEGRLMILCHLVSGEKTVTALEDLLGARQAAVSQQLARLRADGLVTARRDGKAIHYSIRDPKAASIVKVVHDLFCASTC
jgi:ArsR family transcriptional regulator